VLELLLKSGALGDFQSQKKTNSLKKGRRSKRSEGT
jgi:hypothetical protein